MDEMKAKAERNVTPLHPQDRTPPHSDEAEISVLGGMLIEESAADYAMEKLVPDDFYHPAHRLIFEAIQRLRDQGHAPDALSVREELQKLGNLERSGGSEYLARIVDIVPTAANIAYHVRIVLDNAVKRRLITVGTRVVGETYDSSEDADVLLNRAEEEIFRLGERRYKKSFLPITDMLQGVVQQIEARSATERLSGAPSGFKELDNLTGGFQLSDLIILAARPSIGKTSLALNIASNLAIYNRTPVAIFSMEMSMQHIVQRLISCESLVSLQSLKVGRGNMEDWTKLSDACERLRKAPIYIDDSGILSAMEMRSKARRIKLQRDVGLIIVDYLQLMESGRRTESRQQEITEISRSLKALAKELNIPVIALSQLSRAPEQRSSEEQRPRLSDLRESGAIEQDADLVIFLYKEKQKTDPLQQSIQESKEEHVEVILGKNRNGPIGDFKLRWIARFTRFEDYDPMLATV